MLDGNDIYGKIERGFYAIMNTGEVMFSGFSDNWGGSRTTTQFLQRRLTFVQEVIELAKRVPIRFYEGSYYIFDDKIWIPISEKYIWRAYDTFVRKMQILPMVGDHAVFKDYFLGTIAIYSELVPNRSIVAFNNGVLDLDDYTFHDFDPKYHVIYMHPYDYDPRAKANKWRHFLTEVLPDPASRKVLQLYLGLGFIERGCIYNRCEGKDFGKVELCLILLGSGANGKSVIYQTAVGIFGADRITAVDYDDLVAPGDEGMRARSVLNEAIFNWSSDGDPRTFGKKRSGVFKRIVSGEPVTTRRIGKDVTENFNMPYLIFNLNELPAPDDATLGFIRRLQYISFDVTIPKEKQNPKLPYELKEEYSGILNWILKGSKELRANGFVFPQVAVSKKLELQTLLSASPLQAWFKAYGVRSRPQAPSEVVVEIPASTLYDSYVDFCITNNVDPSLSKIKFGMEMSKIGFNRKHRPDVRYLVYGCTEKNLRTAKFIEDAVSEEDIIKLAGFDYSD